MHGRRSFVSHDKRSPGRVNAWPVSTNNSIEFAENSVLAESLQNIKKMYQVFVEDSYARLGVTKDGINNYDRKIMEFELDDEYLARLQEVLEMRRDIMAELARILAEDPRLLRRFMDNFVDQQDSLRDQMTLLAERQKRLEREVRAWNRVKDDKRDALYCGDHKNAVGGSSRYCGARFAPGRTLHGVVTVGRRN